MRRDYKQHIDDILEAVGFIREYISGMDFKSFQSDRKTQDAVIRNLEVIGEAAKSLPQDIKAVSENIEWHKLVALRNILIHEYFGVNLNIVWDVVVNKLDQLESACRKLL